MAEPEAVKESPLGSFVDYVRRALDIVQLKAEVIDETARDERAFAMGLGIVALAGVASAVGTFFLPGVVFYPILMIAGAFICAGLLHLLATMAFKGSAEFLPFFRVLSHSFVLLWVLVIPVLGWVLGGLAELWMLVVLVFAIERVYKLDRSRAIATVAIPLGAALLLVVIFGGFMGLILYLTARA